MPRRSCERFLVDQARPNACGIRVQQSGHRVVLDQCSGGHWILTFVENLVSLPSVTRTRHGYSLVLSSSDDICESSPS